MEAHEPLRELTDQERGRLAAMPGDMPEFTVMRMMPVKVDGKVKGSWSSPRLELRGVLVRATNGPEACSIADEYQLAAKEAAWGPKPKGREAA